MNHLTTIHQFETPESMEDLFTMAHELKAMDPRDYPQELGGLVVASLFYEPSTRTRLSFEAAALRLGGKVIGTENAGEYSSAAKGETLEDSIRTVAGYTDAIVLRHPTIGSAKLAAEYSMVPVINAGDGAGEHPTQALLDLFTIKELKSEIDGLKVGLAGDLLNGRTIHSLQYLLSLYRPTMYCIAPEQLQLPMKYQRQLRQADVEFELLENWDAIIDKLDVLYMTRVQRERFEEAEEYEQVKDSFILDVPDVQRMQADAIIMHPLPRVGEITPAVDTDPRAQYFEQARNGMFVRMALLRQLLS